jgi:prevent-host-death family protein
MPIIHRLFLTFSHADFELRVEPWRVFYRVHEELVIVELVGVQKRQRVVNRWKGVRIMKIESLRKVKAKLSKIIKELPSEKSVVITKNGRPCAVLFPVTEKTDLESLLLAQRKDFWQLLDRAHKEGEKKGFTRLEDLPD